ncbi:MAG: hypothetical protein ACE14V_07355 [bacterium]
MRTYQKNWWIIVGFLVVLVVSGYTVSLTVSTTGGAGDFNSIQYAINSCLTNPDTPDVITILDNGPYFEALDIGTAGFDLTIQGGSGIRPVIVASITSATTGPLGNRNQVIDILGDQCTTVIKDLVLIPDTTAPAGKGINIAPYSTLSQFSVALINMVIAGNNGSNQPVTMDGRTVASAATTFTLQGIDVASALKPGHISLQKVIVSRATYYVDGNSGLRVLLDGNPTDRSSVDIGAGCVFTYLPQDGVYFGASTCCDGTFSGTSTEPIIISNNARWGIWDYNNAGKSAVNKLDWVIITNNASMGYRVSGSSNQPSVTMTNCTFANNALSTNTAQIDFSVTTSTNFTAYNVIFAGNSLMTSTRANTVINGSGASSLTINTCALVITGLAGATPTYSLSTMVSANGVVGVGTFTQNGGINENPDFASLDLTSADFVAVRNPHFATVGPNGGPLTGGGKYLGGGTPAELSRFDSE